MDSDTNHLPPAHAETLAQPLGNQVTLASGSPVDHDARTQGGTDGACPGRCPGPETCVPLVRARNS